jgi:hypothetical protein
MERRRHRILSVLFIAVEKHGYQVKVDDRGRTFFEIDRELAYFTLQEKYRQVRRPLTDEEKRRGFNPKRPWKQETQSTGLLQFSVDTGLDPALIHLWSDTPEQSLEQQLPEVVALFLAAAPLLRERRRRYEEAEQRRREEELRRYEERQRSLQDRNRLRAFLELAARSKEVQVAREFLIGEPGGGTPNGTKLRAPQIKRRVYVNICPYWGHFDPEKVSTYIDSVMVPGSLSRCTPNSSARSPCRCGLPGPLAA